MGRAAVTGGRFTESMPSADARAVRRWLAAGRDVYVYFNNDLGGHAVANARRLAEVVATGP